MAKKTARQRVVKRLDDVTYKYIRERDAKCVQCQTTENLTNGHVFSRRSYSTRWDISKDGNCHTQCWGCNFKHSKDNYDYFKWYVDKFSKDKFENLRFRYKETKKYTTIELEELYEELSLLSSCASSNKRHRIALLHIPYRWLIVLSLYNAFSAVSLLMFQNAIT